MAITILGLNVGTNERDAALKEEFLSFNPGAGEIRQLPSSATVLHRHFYDDGSRVANYVFLTGDRLICFMVREIDREQSDEIERRLDVPARMVLPQFQFVVEGVVGKAVDASWYARAFLGP